LCEKPFARDAGEARAMLEAAQRAGIVHLVGHEFRWTPERALFARAIAEGLIGRP
jgi:predicted dehydrogenase